MIERSLRGVDDDLLQRMRDCLISNNVWFSNDVSCLTRKFFDQSILCNSVIWTCSITGKHNLTFQEAKDSEAKALQTTVFPRDLQRPLLFLASLTRRRNATDITEDLYRFSKKRFFIGEVVEVIVSGAK